MAKGKKSCAHSFSAKMPKSKSPKANANVKPPCAHDYASFGSVGGKVKPSNEY